MRKIKKFKIPIYSYDILRKARKRRIDLFALGLAAPESAKEHIASLAASIEPATVFDFIAPDDPLSAAPGPLLGGSLTAAAVTLGEPFAARLAAMKDAEHLRLAETAALVFCETGLKVITELVSQDTSMEGFEPGPAAYLFACPEPDLEDGPPRPAPPETVAAALARLQADKIGVRLENGAVFPKYTVVFALPWLSRKKKKLSPAPKK